MVDAIVVIFQNSQRFSHLANITPLTKLGESRQVYCTNKRYLHYFEFNICEVISLK